MLLSAFSRSKWSHRAARPPEDRFELTDSVREGIVAKTPIEQVDEDIKNLKIAILRKKYDHWIAHAAKAQQEANEIARATQLAVDVLKQIRALEKS